MKLKIGVKKAETLKQFNRTFRYSLKEECKKKKKN
jgi:hypothetical protein